jgi:hypothetical protein
LISKEILKARKIKEQKIETIVETNMKIRIYLKWTNAKNLFI